VYLINPQLFMPLTLLIFTLPCLATYQNNSEGNDIIPFPFASKNAYLGNKWPNPSQIPYEIDSTFGNF
jgi:hypothetical protein